MDLPVRTDTVVIGAGHNGLAMSRLLSLGGRDHVVLERRATLGGGWQDRWDAFRLVSPNWTTSFPGQPYDGPKPDAFMPRDEIVATVRRYADTVKAPVVTETHVSRLAPRPGGTGFRLETNQGPLEAERVVVATGGFIARTSRRSPRRYRAITAVHSFDYRRDGPAARRGARRR
jgi:putative flavoprotein involved in K+ transport